MADQHQPDNDRPMPDVPPDAMSDADKIRAKRLAKLGASSTSNTSSQSPSHFPAANPAASSTPQPTEKAPAPAAPSLPQANPFTQLGVKEDDKQASRITIKPRAAQASGGPPDTQTAPRTQDTSVEAWTDRTLGGIFRITLDPDITRDLHGHRLCFVSRVRSDLDEAGSPLRLTTDVLDSALLQSAESKTGGRPLDYFLACWKRVSKLFRTMTSKNDPKVDVVKEARRLCFSYCIFAATMPEMFGEEPSAGNALAEHLLVDPDNDRGICHDFLNEAVSRFDDDDVREVLVGAIEEISQRLSKMTMNDDYRPYMLAMRNFVRYQPLLTAMAHSPLFLPPQIEPQAIETNTLLGPFFRISPLQGEVAMNYFSTAGTRDKAYITNSQRSLRLALQTHQEELFDIANCFIKIKDARENILDWLALTVNANHKRRALRPDPKTTSSDAFMVNITVVLDRLCEPFMDTTFSKVDRIDIDYLRRSPRVSIKDETKMNADQGTSDKYYSTDVGGTNNFITEIFFLTVAAHHYGIEAANTKLSELQKDLKYLEKEMTKMEAERHKYIANPAYLAVFDSHLKKYKDRLEKGHCTVYATQGVLLDETTQARSMQFMRYVIAWILRLVAPDSKFPTGPLQLPLPVDEPMAFKCLPEYFLEDICDNFKFITQYMPHIITSTQCEELMTICITFLRSSEYIKSPYLKGTLITILYYGVYPISGRSKGVLGDILFAHKFATKHLLHALMKFYIECEFVGNVPGFPGKFSIRYEIFQVIKCIWPNPIYRRNLGMEAQVNLDFFVQFVNLLLNDVTFVLDESFTAFTQIHDLTKLLRNPPEDMDANVRQEKEELLSAAKDKAKSYMQLTNETVAMLKLFTETLGDSFTKKEVVVRLAHMLDYNLEALTGPKKANLKVENPADYGWDPKAMLSEISDVYLNLRNKEVFINSVATDGRSYRPEYFITAATIMQRFALKAPEQIREWEELAERIKTAKEEAELEEEDLGEIPDEYMDPLLATLMEDPVILPTSKQTLDRSTVRSHLLSDPHDPFNRVPLTIDDVIPNDALRDEIQKWKSARLAEKLAERSAVNSGEPMDTS